MPRKSSTWPSTVGAGVSGVYSGWRLLNDGPGKKKITVFEGSGRVGGRLLSLTPPGMPHTRCEIGGMRYMTRHVLVAWLVKKFKLATEEMGVGNPANIAYLRGQLRRQADLNTPSLMPYHFSALEKNIVEDPKNALLMYALQQILPDCLGIPTSNCSKRSRPRDLPTRPCTNWASGT